MRYASHKIFIHIAFIIFLPNILYCAETIKLIPNTDDQLRINISVNSKLAIKPSQPLIVSVTVENNSSINYTYSESIFTNDYKFFVTRIDQNESVNVDRTAFGKQFNDSFRTLPRVFPPGHSIENRIIINRIFDMSIPGKYKIYVSRYFHNPSEENNLIDVSSNELLITIQEDNFYELGNDCIRNTTGSIITPLLFLPPSVQENFFPKN